MAQHRQRGFPSITMRFLAQLSATALTTVMLCAASTTTAQPQTLPLPVPPQPTATTPTTPATAPAVPSQLPAPCPPAQATLAPCLRFFTSNSSSPPAECCAQIRAMFQSQAPCLCAAMASGPAAQLGGLGSALGQLLPTSCDLPANACSGTTPATGGGAPEVPTTTTPATGSGAAEAAPETGAPTGAGTTAPGGGGAGVKSVPGMIDTGAAAAGSRGVSAAAGLFMSLLGVYIL